MFPYIHIVLPSYTVMALVGGFVTLCLIYSRLDRYEVDFTTFLAYFFVCVIGGFLGSKVLFALTQINWLIKNFSIHNLILLIPQSGLVFYGGLFGVIFTLLFLTRKDIELRKRIFRLSVPGIPLFHAFGRIGCFLTGCCYGKELSSSVRIGSVEFNQIPVQLIEAIFEILLFIVIMFLDKYKEEIDLLKVYLICYANIRFFDEFLRGDEIRGIMFGISTAQWISMMIIIYYVMRMLHSKKKEMLTEVNN